MKGGDCDDANNTIYPDAPELCDSINNDCDAATDEDIVQVECRADADGDMVAVGGRGMRSCSCDAGTIPVTSTSPVDCLDTNPDVFEGQTLYFNEPRVSGCRDARICYDYDCDGTGSRQYPSLVDCGFRFPGGCTGAGWVGEVPACGQSGQWRNCIVANGSCTGLALPSTRIQACR